MTHGIELAIGIFLGWIATSSFLAVMLLGEIAKSLKQLASKVSE